jgi:hypothetical protein
MMEKQRPLEYCFHCGGPTGKAGQGDGSLYCECDAGPFCEDCWEEHHQGNVLAFKLATTELAGAEMLDWIEAVINWELPIKDGLEILRKHGRLTSESQENK